MKKEFCIALVLLLPLLLFTQSFGQEYHDYHSEGKKDYRKLIELQHSTEQNISQTYDFDYKISSCDNVINSLDRFIREHHDSEVADKAKIDRSDWVARKIAIKSKLESLTQELSSSLHDKAVQAAKHKRKLLFKVDKIDQISQDRHTDGAKLVITNVYAVRMKSIIGGVISNLTITATGTIGIDDRRLLIDDNPKIAE